MHRFGLEARSRLTPTHQRLLNQLPMECLVRQFGLGVKSQSILIHRKLLAPQRLEHLEYDFEEQHFHRLLLMLPQTKHYLSVVLYSN